MRNLFAILLILVTFCSCSWDSQETRPSLPPRQPPPLPDVQLPDKPNVPEFQGYVLIPPGGIITWSEKSANQKAQKKELRVNKFGGAFLDKQCLDNVKFALQLWKYYQEAVERQINAYNKGLEKLRKPPDPPKRNSWW